MSSAANDPRHRLEEEFKRRMYDAEASPSQHLWGRIDHSLTVQENGEYKKHVVFYRQLAAACLALLLIAAAAGSYYFGTAPATGPTIALVPPAPEAAGENEGLASANEVNASPVSEPVETALQTGTAKPTKGRIVPPNLSQQTKGGYANASAAGTAATSAKSLPADIQIGDFTFSGEAAEASKTSFFNISLTSRRLLAVQQAKPAMAAQVFPGASLAISAPEPAATNDFRQQSQLAMARAQQQEDAKKALLTQETVAAGINKAAEEEGRGEGRWSLAMAYAPGYFDQNISAGAPGQAMATLDRNSIMPDVTSTSSAYMSEAREEYNHNTDPGFSFGVEVKSGFKLGKKLKLLAGLGFLQNTTRSKSSYVLQEPDNMIYLKPGGPDKSSVVYLPSISTQMTATPYVVAKRPAYDVDYRYRYLSVPVGLQYEGSVSDDWFWYGGAGVAANILLQTSITAAAPEVEGVAYSRNEESPFQQTQWSGNASAGVGKRLAGNLSITMGPEVRSYFSSMLADQENAPGKPYTIGMNLAVNYELGGGKRNR